MSASLLPGCLRAQPAFGIYVTNDAGIPLTAIALAVSGLGALLIVWAGVVVVNVAFARRS